MNSQITALTQTSSTLFQQRGTLTKRSSPRVVCQAQPKHQVVFETVKQAGLIAAAAGILSLAPTNDAVFAAATRNTSYEEQLLSSIKSRTGKDDVLPSLKSSPKVEPLVKEAAKKSSEVPVKKVVSETPRPSIGGKTAPADAPTLKGFDAPKESAPKPAAVSAAPAPKPAAAPSSSESEGDNKNAIVLGGIVLVAVAGIAVAGGNNGEGEASPAAAPSTPAAPAADSVDQNVAEARAWIAAWKKKHNKA